MKDIKAHINSFKPAASSSVVQNDKSGLSETTQNKKAAITTKHEHLSGKVGQLFHIENTKFLKLGQGKKISSKTKTEVDHNIGDSCAQE